MQTRRKASRSKRKTSFSSFNNESENYESDDDIELNNLQNHILQTKHPFEINGLTDGKPVSVIQKVITYFINKNGGWAHEKKIFQFLNDNWADITQISKKRFQNKPKPRLLHINLSAKKKGQYLFIKKGPNSLMYRINSGEDGEIPEMTEDQSKEDENENYEEEDEYSDSDTENKTDLQLGEEEDEQNELDGPDAEFSTFESCLIQILQNSEKPLTEAEIVKKATPYSNIQGLYQNLNIEWRVRACLIFLKINHEVFVDDNGEKDLWSLRPPIRHISTVLFLEDDFQPVEPSKKAGVNANLDELLKRCQKFRNKCLV